MKKLFISLPMRNRTIPEIKQERNDILEWFKEFYSTFATDHNLQSDFDFQVIDTIWSMPIPEGTLHGCWYLGKSISALATADLAIFSPEYYNASGCIIERGVCDIYNIPMIILEYTKHGLEWTYKPKHISRLTMQGESHG